MTAAPDAQPPAGLWWSAKHNAVVAKHPYGECYDLIEQDPMGWRDTEELSALPADAVRLVAADDDPIETTAEAMLGEIEELREQLAQARAQLAIPASAALDGTTAEVIEAAREFVRHTEMAIDAGWKGLGRPVFPFERLRAAVAALLAPTPTRTAQEG